MKVDLTSHGSSIAILLGLDVLCMAALIYAYRCGSLPADLLSLLRDVFAGWNGALMLALTGGSKPPAPPAVPLLAETK